MSYVDSDGCISDGGPAFPILDREWDDGKPYYVSFGGMTLRDYFAAKAMQSKMLCEIPDKPPKGTVGAYIAQQAYAMADAMLKAREA